MDQWMKRAYPNLKTVTSLHVDSNSVITKYNICLHFVECYINPETICEDHCKIYSGKILFFGVIQPI